jgi:hypothetical protein
MGVVQERIRLKNCGKPTFYLQFADASGQSLAGQVGTSEIYSVVSGTGFGIMNLLWRSARGWQIEAMPPEDSCCFGRTESLPACTANYDVVE